MTLSVSRFGVEFGHVEQQLRLQLNAPQCVISDMHVIKINALIAHYNTHIQRMDNPNEVDVFIDLETTGQTLREIQANGLKLPENGLRFNTSRLRLEPGKENYKLLHLIVALGKVYNNMTPLGALEEEEVFANPDNVGPDNLPHGFNTLRLSKDDDFVLFNDSQYYVKHFLNVNGGDNIEPGKLNDFVCEQCHKAPAIVFCINDQLMLCEQCDNKLHKANDVTKNHERKPLGDVIALFQDCPEHPGNKVQYYCPTCKLPLCMECKVSGSHSRKDTLKHKLIPIQDAYKNRSLEVQKPSEIRQQREKALSQAIIEAEDLVETLNDNLKKMIEEINKVAAAAIQEAKELTGEKLIVVKSSLSELQRKYDELRSQRRMLLTTFTNAEPVTFLQTFARIEELDKYIETSIDLQKPIDVKNNLSVYGRLQVSEPKEKPQTPFGVAERDLKGDAIAQGDNAATSQSLRPLGHDDDLQLLQKKAVKFTSLDKMADRKAKKYAEAGKEINFTPFEGSEIITDPALARKLYLCFPFKAVPETHLMFSTTTDGRDIKKMHKLVDGKGISVILVRSGERIFGGFAASKWNNEAHPFGEGTSSFLFSVDNNAFIPAHPQSEDPIYLLGTPDTFSFGGEDLVLAGDFDRCGSTIENTFGIGLEYGSEEAQNFLAGSPRFKADDVEVWGFFTPPPPPPQ